MGFGTITIGDLKWSPDSKRICIISAGETREGFIWDVDKAALLKTFPPEQDRYLESLTFSLSGSFLTLKFSDHTMELWDSDSLRRKKLRGHGVFIWDVSFAPDDSMLASLSRPALCFWNASSGAFKYVIKSKGDEEIEKCTWAPDSKTIALTLKSGKVHLWDVVSMTLRHIIDIDGQANYSKPIYFSPNGDKLAVFTKDNSLSCWNAETAVCEQTLQGASCQRTWLSGGKKKKRKHMRFGDKLIDFFSGNMELKSPEGIHKMSFHRDWIFYGDQKLIWLPPDYRITSFEAYDSILAMGHPSACVTFLELDFQSDFLSGRSSGLEDGLR